MDLHPGEEIVFQGHPSWRAVLRFYVIGVALAAAAAALAVLISGTTAAVVAGLAVVVIVLIVGFLKRIGTLYVITTERLHIRRGILARRTQETRIQRVQNVNTQQSLFARIMRVGTVDFDTAGTDDSDFTFAGVADPRQVVSAVDRAQRAAAREEHSTENPLGG